MCTPAPAVAIGDRARNLDEALYRGDVIEGRYRICSEIGRGGFGVVYAAEHVGTGQPVALKIALQGHGAGEVSMQRFWREARSTAALRHTNTVRVFDVGQTPTGRAYLVMELVMGPTLESVLRECDAAGRCMTQIEAIGIALAVLGSLSEAHTRGLIHRDLKPANIVLDEVDGEAVVKVLDFGIAHCWDSSLTAEGTLLGTPTYMSPEQCAGRDLDGRSDLYALGVVLYRCVTGVPPLGGANPMSTMFAHLHETPRDIAELARTPVSREFADVIMKALAKEPDQRFASARAMRSALLEALRADASPPWRSARSDGLVPFGMAVQPDSPVAGRPAPLRPSPAHQSVKSDTGPTGNVPIVDPPSSAETGAERKPWWRRMPWS